MKNYKTMFSIDFEYELSLVDNILRENNTVYYRTCMNNVKNLKFDANFRYPTHRGSEEPTMPWISVDKIMFLLTKHIYGTYSDYLEDFIMNKVLNKLSKGLHKGECFIEDDVDLHTEIYYQFDLNEEESFIVDYIYNTILQMTERLKGVMKDLVNNVLEISCEHQTIVIYVIDHILAYRRNETLRHIQGFNNG